MRPPISDFEQCCAKRASNRLAVVAALRRGERQLPLVLGITAQRCRFFSTRRAPGSGNTTEPVDHKREETAEHDHAECDGAAAAEKLEEMREDPVDHRAD